MNSTITQTADRIEQHEATTTRVSQLVGHYEALVEMTGGGCSMLDALLDDLRAAIGLDQ